MDDGGPTDQPSAPSARGGRLSRRSLLATAAFIVGSSAGVEAKDYSSRREALDELDRLSGLCGMRLGAVRRARPNSELLAGRFLTTLQKHRASREAVRRRFSLPPGADPAAQLGEVDAELAGLRQALDDLMIAYAESLPVFADATVVSKLAVDMVEVSRLRTVIDLWVGSEEG